MNPFRILTDGVTDGNVYKRIGWMYITFFGIFLPTVIASYYLLPEGILRGKHPIISQLEFSSDLLILTLQIFGYNLLLMILIIAANLIAQQSRIAREKFVPIGYTAFWVVTLLLAVYTGTWSFEVVTAAPPLQDRLVRVFDILHHSGLVEISAYILAAVTSYKFTLWYSDGRRVIRSRRREDIKLDRSEKVFLVLAFVLLFCGAIIESYGIVQFVG